MENCRFEASSTRNKALKMDYQGAPALLVDHDRGSSKALCAWTAVTEKQKRKVNSVKTRQDKKARRTSEGTEPRRHKGDEDTGPKSKAGLQATAQKKKKRGASKAPGPSRVGDVRVRAQKRKLREDGEERRSPADAALARFQDRYVQQQRLGYGGCGSVFAGYRKKNSLLVAIKHIPHDKVYCKYMTSKGKEISMEVVAMLKLKAARKTCLGAFAPIALLDWFDLDEKLILVLERPVPSKDLLVYRDNKGGCLEEGEARILLKQLVGAALYLQEMRIFHRDIKMENILIQTNRTVPAVRLIDFGLSCFVKDRSVFSSFYGTAEHAPPEWHQHSQCWAGPSTVWQLGVVLYEILHKHSAFNTKSFLLKNELEMDGRLSDICKDFLKKCLTPFRLHRATLQELKQHLWLL